VVAAVFALFAVYHKVAAKASCYKRKEYWRVILVGMRVVGQGRGKEGAIFFIVI